MFVSLERLTSNDMFGLGDFWDKSPSWFLKILKLLSLYLGSFKVFKNVLGQFITNRPSKHLITSTNYGKFVTDEFHKCYNVFRDDTKLKTGNKQKIHRKQKDR